MATTSPWEYAADLLDPPDGSDVELALRCRTDLAFFIEQAWPIVEPAEEYVHGWHLQTVFGHLEAVSAGDVRRLIINVPPRTMKSLSVAVFWPAWEWLTHPERRWVFASYAASLANRDSMKMRRLVKSKGGAETGTIFQRIGYQGVLRLLDPNPWGLTSDQDEKTKYETTRTGMRLSTSVGGTATGEGGDRIVVDDPLNAKQARSDLERTAANVWWDETMSTRFNNDRAAAVIVMQRLHEQDLTGHLLERGGWDHLCLPAEYEPRHKAVTPATVTLRSGHTVAGDPRTEEGELLDPVRLGAERLVELRRDLGSYSYAGQMQQAPAPDEGGMFKRGWWRYWDATASTDDEEGLPLDFMWDRVVASWDMRFSDTQSASSSYVVGQVWGKYRADYFLLAQVRGKLGFTDTLRAVLAVKDAYPLISAILVERKANGAAVMQTLKRRVPGLIPIEPEGGKEVRAAAVEPLVEAGNVRLPTTDLIDAPDGFARTSVDTFIDELAVFPNGTHDDQVDAFSQAATWMEARAGGYADLPLDVGGEETLTGALLDTNAF